MDSFETTFIYLFSFSCPSSRESSIFCFSYSFVHFADGVSVVCWSCDSTLCSVFTFHSAYTFTYSQFSFVLSQFSFYSYSFDCVQNIHFHVSLLFCRCKCIINVKHHHYMMPLYCYIKQFNANKWEKKKIKLHWYHLTLLHGCALLHGNIIYSYFICI